MHERMHHERTTVDGIHEQNNFLWLKSAIYWQRIVSHEKTKSETAILDGKKRFKIKFEVSFSGKIVFQHSIEMWIRNREIFKIEKSIFYRLPKVKFYLL